jgi:hypothetical protein
MYLLHWDLAIACSCGFVPEVYWVTLCLFWQNTGWKFGQGWHSFHETLKFDTAESLIPKIHLHLYFSTVPLTAPSYAQLSSLAGWCFLFLRSTSSLHSLRTRFDYISLMLLCASAHWSDMALFFVSTLACSSRIFLRFTVLHMRVRVCPNE